MAVVSCLLFCGITVALCELGRPLYGGMGQSLRTQEKGQALTYRGVLSLAGVIYFAQFKQIVICLKGKFMILSVISMFLSPKTESI